MSGRSHEIAGAARIAVTTTGEPGPIQLGVIQVYRLVRKEVPGLQLALIGVGDMEVSALQTSSNVVVQKSIREGFGLGVSETMWKGTPVVANRSGGIPLQMQDGAGGFLVDDTEECAKRVLFLLHNRDEARRRGLAGRQRVRQRFLITRLLADELRLLTSLASAAGIPAPSASAIPDTAASLPV